MSNVSVCFGFEDTDSPTMDEHEVLPMSNDEFSVFTTFDTTALTD